MADAALPDAVMEEDGGGGGDAAVCPEPEELWDDIDIAQFTALPALSDIGGEGQFTLAEPATYWELRRAMPGAGFEVVFSVGDKCAEADDSTVCSAEFDDMTADEGFGPSCLPGQCFQYIAVNRENTNQLIISREELVTFLGTIDSPAEAAMIAFSHGYNWDADEVSAGSARASDQGYVILATELVDDCDPIITDRVELQVSPEGELTESRSQVYRVSCGACI